MKWKFWKHKKDYLWHEFSVKMTYTSVYSTKKINANTYFRYCPINDVLQKSLFKKTWDECSLRIKNMVREEIEEIKAKYQSEKTQIDRERNIDKLLK